MFRTDRIASAFARMVPSILDALEAADAFRYAETQDKLATIGAGVDRIAVSPSDPDDIPNDLYIFSRIVDFFRAYNGVWRDIHGGQFAASWTCLQDALDYLRAIKRFSNDSASAFDFFESQVPEIEKLYPYKVFASIGAIIGRCECSICGADMNGGDCPHLMGELYRGKIAHDIVTSIEGLDHTALVTDPADKRCVVQIEDNDERFRVVRYLSGLLTQGVLSPLHFRRAESSKRRTVNPDYREQPRNALCRCGSGRKHKKCCLSKKYFEDHVEIVYSHRSYSWRPIGGGIRQSDANESMDRRA